MTRTYWYLMASVLLLAGCVPCERTHDREAALRGKELYRPGIVESVEKDVVTVRFEDGTTDAWHWRNEGRPVPEVGDPVCFWTDAISGAPRGVRRACI